MKDTGTMLKQILTLFAFLLILTSCEKDDMDPDVLPPATQSGANTGGALFNGKVWVAKKIDQYNSSNQYFTELRKDGASEEMLITLQNNLDHNGKVLTLTIKAAVIKEGTYDVSIDGGTTARYFKEIETFYIQQPNGTITITKLDRNARIVSGVFNFTVANKAGTEIEIKEGRFDKRYYNFN